MPLGRLFSVGGIGVNLLRIVLAVVLAMYASAVQAQALAKPKEFYFDQDSAAAPIVVVKAEGDALAEQLMRERERGRRKIEATAQLAHVAMSSDRAELGESLYEQALQSTSGNSGIGRSVRWNYGWDLYRSGKPDAALGQWSAAVTSIGGPSWVPPTLAMALWTLGRRTEAVQWYAAAVRTDPLGWGSPGNSARLLPAWRQQDREVLAQVHAAWQANPPSWP